MDSMLSLINEYSILVGAIVLTLVLIVIMKIWWDTVSLHMLNLYYRFPVFGKLSKLSRDYTSTNSNVENSNQTWFSSEETLCMDYFNHYQMVDKDGDHFDKCSRYLQRVDETGRNNLHIMGWILVALMVFVEAMGFSYVLSGFTIPGASEDLQQVGALGIAFLVSVLLVAFTHFSGHELHYNNLIKKTRSIWSKQASSDEALINDNSVTFENDHDDNQPQWKQMLNRLPHNADVTPSYTITIGALMLITFVAVGATYVRGKVLDEEASSIHLSSSTSVASSSYQSPYAAAPTFPTDLDNEVEKADKEAAEASLGNYKSAGWGTFIVLAIIFIFIQLLGILIGFKTGFSGKESSKARTDMGKFKTKREFEAFYQRKKTSIARMSQKNLGALQQKLAKKISQTATDKDIINLANSVSDRNFLAYADLQHSREDESHKKDLERHTHNNDASKSSQLKPTPSPAEEIAADNSSPETPKEMEARIRKEIEEAEQAVNSAKQESEEDMKKRIIAENAAKKAEERAQSEQGSN